MRLFARVVSVQLRCLVSSVSRQDRGCGVRVLVGLAYGVLAVLLATYSAFLGMGLEIMGADGAVPVFCVAVGTVAGVAFTLYKASGLLYEAGDYGLMMSWPIPERVQVAARTASLVLANVAMTALVALPMGIAAMALGASFGVGPTAVKVLALVACVALASLPGTGVAVLVAAAVTMATARLTHAKAVYTVFMVALALVFMVAYFALVGSSPSISGEGEVQAVAGVLAAATDGISAAWPPAALLRSAWVSPEAAGVVPLVLFCAVCVAVGALCLEVVARTYRRTMAALASVSGPRRAARVGAARSAFAALCRKEVGQVFDTTSVVVNDLLGLLLMVVLAGAVAAVGLEGVMGALDIPASFHGEMGPVMAAAVPWALAFCASMAPVPAVSVSLEGRCSWIMETLPVPVPVLMASKVVPWAVACLGASAVSAVLVAVAGLPWTASVLSLAVPCATFWLTANIGLFLDGRRPDFQWTSPAALAKRGLPITVSVVVSMVACIIMAGLVVAGPLLLGWPDGGAAMASLVVAAVFAVVGSLLFWASCRRPVPRERL